MLGLDKSRSEEMRMSESFSWHMPNLFKFDDEKIVANFHRVEFDDVESHVMLFWIIYNYDYGQIKAATESGLSTSKQISLIESMLKSWYRFTRVMQMRMQESYSIQQPVIDAWLLLCLQQMIF